MTAARAAGLVPIAEARGLTLHWRQPRLFGRAWTLEDESGRTFAHMTTLRGWRFHVHYRSAEGEWTFGPWGWWRGASVATPAAGGPPVTFHPSWWMDGSIAMGRTRPLRWRMRGLWRATWTVEGESLTPHLTFHSRVGLLRPRAQLELAVGTLSDADLAMLAGFGWFLMLCARRRAATS